MTYALAPLSKEHRIKHNSIGLQILLTIAGSKSNLANMLGIPSSRVYAWFRNGQVGKSHVDLVLGHREFKTLTVRELRIDLHLRNGGEYHDAS